MRVSRTFGGLFVLVLATAVPPVAGLEPLDPVAAGPVVGGLGLGGGAQDTGTPWIEAFYSLREARRPAGACPAGPLAAGAQAHVRECAAPDERTRPPQRTLHPWGQVNTPSWYASFSPLTRLGQDAFVRFHGSGGVAAVDAAGETLWYRSAPSLVRDWGLPENGFAYTLEGWAALDPTAIVTRRGVDTGDLTGDGADEVAFALASASGGGGVPEAHVAVLDGRDGSTLYAAKYPGYPTVVLVRDRLLFLGYETGDERVDVWGDTEGRDGTVTTLVALDFQEDSAGLTKWTFVPGPGWARLLDAEPAGSGRLAVAWSGRALGEAGKPGGEVVLLDTASGQALWKRAFEGYPRGLRWDPPGDALIVHEQLDPLVARGPGPLYAPPFSYGVLRFHYRLVGLALAEGAIGAGLDRPDALLTAFDTGDVASPRGTEWILAEHAFLPVPVHDVDSVFVLRDRATIASTRVAAWNPSEGRILWSNEQPCDASAYCRTTMKVLAHDGSGTVAAASRLGLDFWVPRTALESFHGGEGRILWRDEAETTSPLFLGLHTLGGKPTLLSASMDLVVRGNDPVTGDVRFDVPILAEVWAVQAADVNDDGILDFVLGGRSRAVFALDGRDLDDEPTVLWRVRMAGHVHEIEVADLDGDARPEVIATDSRGVEVLRLDSGARVYRLDRPGAFVWTSALGDLDGDGQPDLVIPTDTLAAHRGVDGAVLWNYRPHPNLGAYFGNVVIMQDGTAAAEYLLVGKESGFASRMAQGMVGVRGGSKVWEHTRAGPGMSSVLWDSAFTDPRLTIGGKPFVLFALHGGPTTPPFTMNPAFLALGDGGVLWSGGPVTEGYWHQGFAYADGLLEINQEAVTRVDAPELAETVFAEAFTDVAAARAPDGARLLVVPQRFSSGLTLYPRDVLDGARAADRHHAGNWTGLPVTRVRTLDLDGDGADEILGYSGDVGAMHRVMGLMGSGILPWSEDAGGFVVLGFEERLPAPTADLPRTRLVPAPEALLAGLAITGLAAVLRGRRRGAADA